MTEKMRFSRAFLESGVVDAVESRIAEGMNEGKNMKEISAELRMEISAVRRRAGVIVRLGGLFEAMRDVGDVLPGAETPLTPLVRWEAAPE